MGLTTRSSRTLTGELRPLVRVHRYLGRKMQCDRLTGLMAILPGLLIAGSAGIRTPPTTEVGQALAPTGKLRVGLGRAGVDPHATVMPKGRDAGLAYARPFIEEAKSDGRAKAAIERAGMRGAFVAPLE